MKLKYLELNNIGLFKNEKIVFSTKSTKEVILIWGNNGAGKTTLINSIKIGLLGEKAFLFSFPEYCQFIEDNIVSSRCTGEKVAAGIKLCIEIKEHNQLNEYLINREWLINGDDFREDIKVFFRNELLGFEKKEELLNEISNLIPPSLMDVMIFDGESVINILNNGHMDKFIKSIIYSVFGMDVYANLLKDLNVYLKSTKNDSEFTADEKITLLNLENDYRSALTRKNKISEIIENEKKKYTSLSRKAIYLLTRFSDKTGITVDDISEITDNITDIEKKKEKIDLEIKYINEEILPMKLMQRKIEALLSEIEKEKPYLVINRLEQIKAYFKESKDALHMIDSLEKMIGEDKRIEIKYDLSETDINQINNVSIMIDGYTKEKLISIISDKKNLVTSIREQMLATGKIGDQESQSILSDLENTYNELNKCKDTILSMNMEASTCATCLSDAKEHYESYKKELINRRKGTNSYLNAILYREAMEEFISLNTESICAKLDEKILFDLSKMHFRNNSIKKISISPKTFEIKLFEESNIAIHSNLFSAGEKQVLLGLIIKEAISITNTDSFFLFDTPVGRLDSKNRAVFTNDVILDVAEQVTIFATDSDYSLDDYNNELKNKVTREMVLRRNKSDEIVIKKGNLYEV